MHGIRALFPTLGHIFSIFRKGQESFHFIQGIFLGNLRIRISDPQKRVPVVKFLKYFAWNIRKRPLERGDGRGRYKCPCPQVESFYFPKMSFYSQNCPFIFQNYPFVFQKCLFISQKCLIFFQNCPWELSRIAFFLFSVRILFFFFPADLTFSSSPAQGCSERDFPCSWFVSTWNSNLWCLLDNLKTFLCILFKS